MNIMVHDERLTGAFVRSQAEHIEQTIYETRLAGIQYLDLVPVDPGAHPFAEAVIYQSVDRQGRAEWINGNADDVPMAGVSYGDAKMPVYTAGIGYGWGWEEINKAQLLGLNLTNDKAMAARRAAEEMIDRVALRGDAEKGLFGLINYPGVTVTPAGAAWGSDPDAVLASINAALIGTGQSTNYTTMANTILLPMAKVIALSGLRIPNSTVTLDQFIRQSNAYTVTTGQPLLIRGVLGLETAGLGNTTRMVSYRREPEVLKMHIPMPHRFLTAETHKAGPLRWEVPGVMRLGGLDVRDKSLFRYVDGI